MKWVRWILLVVVGCTLVSQAIGYKIFGAATVVENRPLLSRAGVVARLEAPNFLITTDGSRHAVAGVTFRKEALQMEARGIPRLFNEIEPLRIAADSTKPSGIAAERRIIHWQEHSTPPRFLPPRLPKYEVVDMANFIRDCHLDDSRAGGSPQKP